MGWDQVRRSENKRYEEGMRTIALPKKKTRYKRSGERFESNVVFELPRRGQSSNGDLM